VLSSRMLLTKGIGACLLMALACAAQAHESWLRATTPVPPDGTLTLGLTSGMAFPEDDHAIEPERVTHANWRQGDASGTLTVGERGEHALALGANLPGAATTTVSLELPEKALELDAGNVEEYLQDLGNPADVRARWQQRGTWRERYRKSVKAIVGLRDAGDDARKPVGLPLELVPVTDPRTLHAGDSLELRLLANGKPLAGARVGLNAAGVAPRFAVSDGNGAVTFRELDAGPTLLHAVELRPVNAVDLDWESNFTTLTLDVPHAARH